MSYQGIQSNRRSPLCLQIFHVRQSYPCRYVPYNTPQSVRLCQKGQVKVFCLSYLPYIRLFSLNYTNQDTFSKYLQLRLYTLAPSFCPLSSASRSLPLSNQAKYQGCINLCSLKDSSHPTYLTSYRFHTGHKAVCKSVRIFLCCRFFHLLWSS